MGTTGPETSRRTTEVWQESKPTAIAERLRAVFPQQFHSKIKIAIDQYVDLSAETVRRYMNGQAQSVTFLVAVALVTQTRLEWIITGRGERTEMLERKRLISGFDSRELAAEMLDRVLAGQIAFFEKEQDTRGDRREDTPLETEMGTLKKKSDGFKDAHTESKTLAVIDPELFLNPQVLKTTHFDERNSAPGKVVGGVELNRERPI